MRAKGAEELPGVYHTYGLYDYLPVAYLPVSQVAGSAPAGKRRSCQRCIP